MTIKIEADEKKTSLCIDGELTIYTAQEYRQSIIDGFTVSKPVELDMIDVAEIDTSGLQLLAAISKELAENGSEIKIISASNVVNDAIIASQLIVDLTSDETGHQS